MITKRITMKVVIVFRRGPDNNEAKDDGEMSFFVGVTVVGRVFKYPFSLSGTGLHVCFSR